MHTYKYGYGASHITSRGAAEVETYVRKHYFHVRGIDVF
jgi:hypothetical protein